MNITNKYLKKHQYYCCHLWILNWESYLQKSEGENKRMSTELKKCGLEEENGKVEVESDYSDERAPRKREKHVSGIHSLIARNSCVRQR